MPRHANSREGFRKESDRQKEHGKPAVQDLGVANPPGGLVVVDLVLLARLAVLFFQGVEGRDLSGQGDFVQDDLSGNVLRDPIVVATEFGVPVKVALDLGEGGAVVDRAFLLGGGFSVESGLGR